MLATIVLLLLLGVSTQAFDFLYESQSSHLKSHEIHADGVHLKYNVEPIDTVKVISLDSFLSHDGRPLSHLTCATPSPTTALHTFSAPAQTTHSLHLHFASPTQARVFVEKLTTSAAGQTHQLVLTASRWVLVDTQLSQSHLAGTARSAVPPTILKAMAWKSGCFGKHEDELQQGVASLLRFVHSVAHVHGHEVVLAVSQASYHDIFREASVSFAAHKFPAQSFQFSSGATDQKSQPHAETVTLEMGGGLTMWLSSMWSTVLNVAKQVTSMVAVHIQSIVELTFGSLNFAHSWTIHESPSFNYNPQTQSATASIPLLDGLSCDNCYVVMHEPILTFSLNISDFHLKAMSIVIDTTWEGQLSALFAKSISGDFANSTALPTVQVPPITFSVLDVPFEIDLTIPITVGFTAHVGAEVQAHAYVKGLGRLAFGLEYDGSDGLKPVYNDQVQWSGAVDKIFGSATSSIQLYALPAMLLQMSHIGHVELGFRPSLEMVATISNSQVGNACAGRPGLTAALATNVGLVSTLGATIKISIWSKTIFEKTWTDSPIVNLKIPVPEMTGCVDIPTSLTQPTSKRSVVVHPELVPGAAWHGLVHYLDGCSVLPYAQDNSRASLQLLAMSDDGQTGQFMGSIVARRQNDSIPCVAQSLYLGVFGQNQVKLIPQSSAASLLLCGDGSQAQVDPWFLQGARCGDRAWSRWTLSDETCKCVNIDLNGAHSESQCAAMSQCSH